ncbi:MAG: GGDEF domain-containing protein [Firmicutes bacterium]|nr:GGDEF domain-containing protein [[Eubacterium] siraeum]MCM1487702.1 GGDEF domain-containing protein [Bacillota bacterium]
MNGLEIAFKETKCVNIRIDLTRDIPVTILDKLPSLSKKDKRMNLREVIYADDFPPLADIFSEIVSGRQKSIDAHCRVKVGEDYQWVCLNCTVKKDTFNRSQSLTGTMMNLSEYLDASDSEAVLEGNIKKKREIGETDINLQDASLSEILGEDYLLRIQQALTAGGNISSAICGSKGELLLSASHDKKEAEKKQKYSETEEIRCHHKLLATWTIASDSKEEIEKALPLLKVLAETVTQIANAILVLYTEMENSKTANQQLGSNIEQQILLNNIYTIILEQNDSDEALKMVMKLVGEYLKLDRVSLYDYDSETGYTKLNKEWSNKGVEIQYIFNVDDYPRLMEELNYCDTFFSNSSVSMEEIKKTGIKSFVVSQLAANGKFVGLIFYETLKQERIWSNADKKLLRNISQIVSTMLIRCHMDTELKQQNEKLTRLAFTDPVLEIANRTCLDGDLNGQLGEKTCGAAVSVKITNISTVNEAFGHIHSDDLLKKITEYINMLELEGKKVYRFSGSVLMILLKNAGREQVCQFMDKVIGRFSQPWVVSGEEHYMEMNAGVAFYPQDADACDEIYRCSTVAMYRAMERDSNLYYFYSENKEEGGDNAFNAEQRLRRAVLNQMEGFSVVYTPITDLNGTIKALEAGVRWCDRENGVSPTGKVIKLAEHIGIDELIDTWVINNACALMREIIDMTGRENLVLHLNLTYHELLRSSVHKTIQTAAERYGLIGKNISVEIPEKAQLSLGGDASPILKSLREIGAEVTIDDFGREYMALTALKNSSAGEIKIRAEQFARSEEFDKAALKCVIMMAHNKKIDVCVKHIENEQQFKALEGYAVDLLQGSYILPTMDEEMVKEAFSSAEIEVSAAQFNH